ncbi:sigma-70 family RNA polymerase sigma factor [Stomatohabitans albus]|uniref:sigma-70 family RNA polymerase sigma factor n=1 Tax=Stomatohabitans albus TaxID=3110766 RepID=UPI00300D24A2
MKRISQAVPDDLLDLYFGSLGSVELLTAEDECALAQQIEAGIEAAQRLQQAADAGEVLAPTDMRRLERLVENGDRAFDHFVAANLRLVVSVAAKFSRRSSLDLCELIQEGNLGLIRAVEKFDWRKGFKFSTYATWWIRQAIQRGVASSERTIRLPVALHDALIKVRAARARLEASTGEEPTIEELAEATHLTAHRIRRALEADKRMTSLDRKVGTDVDSNEMGDFVAIAPDSPADTVVETEFHRTVLAHAREHLDERSWYVITRRYGLFDTEVMTLDALGQELGLSRESVRKIESQALNLLQRELTTV